MSEGNKRPEIVKFVSPDDSKAGDQHAFGGVRLDLYEIRRNQHQWGKDTYVIAYKVVDTRVAPVFQSPMAHLFLTKGFCVKCKSQDCEHNNVKRACKAVVDHYEEIHESIFKVKLPKPKVTGEMKGVKP